MSLNESDSASTSQTNSLRLLTTQPNFGECSVAPIWSPHSKGEDTLTSSAHPATHPNNTPEIEHRTRMHQKRPMGLIRCLHRYIRYIRNFRLIRLRKFRGQQPAGSCRRWRNTSGVGEMLDELEWPSLEARRDQSSLLLFHKIHCGAVSIEKDKYKYMTPAHSLKTTRSSHSAQYRRHQTYSDALKNSFSPRTIPHWNSLSPSVANTQSTEEFRALLI